MNKLKTYKIFNILESKSNLDDIIDNCRDILIDISDLSYQHDPISEPFRISSKEVINFRRYIQIKFVKNLPLNKYIDDLIRLNDYLNSEGFIFKDVYCNDKFINYNGIYYEFNTIIRKIKKGEITYPEFEWSGPYLN